MSYQIAKILGSVTLFIIGFLLGLTSYVFFGDRAPKIAASWDNVSLRDLLPEFSRSSEFCLSIESIEESVDSKFKVYPQQSTQRDILHILILSQEAEANNDGVLYTPAPSTWFVEYVHDKLPILHVSFADNGGVAYLRCGDKTLWLNTNDFSSEINAIKASAIEIQKRSSRSKFVTELRFLSAVFTLNAFSITIIQRAIFLFWLAAKKVLFQ